MTKVLAIARREVEAYFTTPVGYVTLALFLVITGIVFSVYTLVPGQAATMRPFFSITAFLLFFIAPAISMRLVAEEMRTGTLEPLMVAPVTETEVVAGKWLGALGFFLLMLAPTLLYTLVLEKYATPDYGQILAGYLGLILVGGLYIAFGLLASTFWASQVLAYLIALFFWLTFWFLTTIVPQYLPDPWSDMLFWMSVNARYANDFARGVVDSSSVIYFVSGIFLFLVIAVKVLESRRWR